MKNYYSISIPKPCHEDWKIMTLKEKGRFCDSCIKTVIDFTKMKDFEIQDFIHKNKSNRICGHFIQTQLDSINLYIPSQVLIKQHGFHKLFLLVLLIAMGTTLMNCTNRNGNKQKIDSVEIVDKENNKMINVSLGLPALIEIDSIPDNVPSNVKNSSKKTIPPPSTPKLTGIMISETVGKIEIETTGDIKTNKKPPIEIDSIEVLEPPFCPFPKKESEEEEELVIGFIIVENPPEFKNTSQNLSLKKKRKYFSQKITNIISENFNTSVCLDLKGKQRIQTRFEIDTLGFVKNIRVRAPHPKLEEEVKRVIKLLPQFIPAKQKGKLVNISYALPIVFQVEE